ncbi:MAG: hypothetical protein JSW05_04525 [Candidatus Thorarchaeota archaeon]|nr:MAG: hypothetical protein JSW05_04525 [Candidatus Thorarchaeota archaeon]
MSWFQKHPIRKDSKSIALLAVFVAMVVALEVYPILGVTDIGIPGDFTIDWTGIPIVIVFLGLGLVYSMVAVAAMWMAIAYRNFVGAAFKGFAEFYTIVGLLAAKLLTMRYDMSRTARLTLYVVFGVSFRAVAMFFTNIYLIQNFFGAVFEGAVIASVAYVIPNVVQAVINIVGGVVLYHLIPENLALQAGLGDDAVSASSRVEELPSAEIEESAQLSSEAEDHQS